MSHENFYSPESLNQPFHDLLRAFGHAILTNLQQPNGILGYPSSLLHEYEQKIDRLLEDRGYLIEVHEDPAEFL